MKPLPHGRWVAFATLLLATVVPPAMAADCAVLLDHTGTILILTDNGTLSHFFVRTMPILSEGNDKPGPDDDEGAAALSYGEGFSAFASLDGKQPTLIARAEGNSSHPTEGVVPLGPCVVRTVRGRPAVLVTPSGVYPPLYRVPPRTEVLVETFTASADGRLGFRTFFRFIGGTAQVKVDVQVYNLSSQQIHLHAYKRFADVDLTGDPANAFFVGYGALEVSAMDPNLDENGMPQNGFSRLFTMKSASTRSNVAIKGPDQFAGGAYHNAIGNLLEEQRSPRPIFTEEFLGKYHPFPSPGATRRTIGFGDTGDPLVFGDTPDDFEDDRVLIISHNFAPGYLSLPPWGTSGQMLFFSFQYEVQ